MENKVYIVQCKDYDEVEDKLQIECTPLSWPIGMGKRFVGVFDMRTETTHLFNHMTNKHLVVTKGLCGHSIP